MLELERTEDVEVVEVVLVSEDLRLRKLGRRSFGMRVGWLRPTVWLVTGSRG
jgi:hypothetical protein